MSKKVYLTIILASLSALIYSQKCNNSLKGVVKDFHNGAPIIGAALQVENSNKYTTTDSEGNFVLKNLCQTNFVLIVSHIACETKRITIDITKEPYKKILLEHHIEELNEVRVKAEVGKQTKTAQESVLKTAILEQYVSLSLGDALKEIPGVSSINTGNTIVKPMINGLHSSRLIIMNNGVRLQDQEWGIEHAPSVDINSAEQISVIKGAGALAYGGDAIGGVVVVKPGRIILKDTLYGKTIVGGQTNGRGYFINSSLNKNYKSGWFAKLQASYKRNGDFRAPDYNLSNTGLDAKGISTRFGKKNFETGFEVYYSYLDTEIGILGTSHIGSPFDLARAINATEPFLIRDFTYDIDVPKQDVTHHLAKVNFYKRYKNFGKVNAQYDYQYNQRLEFDVRIGDRRFIPAVDLVLQTHSFLVDVNLDKNLNRKINFGAVGRYQTNFASPSTGARRLIPDYDKFDFGAYTTAEILVNDNLLLDAGIRYDFSRIDAEKFYLKSRWAERGYDVDFSNLITRETPTQFLTNPVLNFHNVSASVGLKYDLNENSYLLGNYALSNRAPNPSELFSDGLHHSAARFEFGDLRIGKETSNRISATYNYSSSNFNMTVDSYFNYINDFIYIRPTTQGFEVSGRGPFPAWEYVQKNARIFGVDLSVSYQFSEAVAWNHKSSFIKGYDLTDDIPLIDMPPFNTTNSLVYTNENWYNFSARVTSELVTKQNEFPDFNYTITDQLTNEQIDVNVSTPPPGYHLMHFSSDATFSLSQKTSLHITFSVNNIFNTSYRNYLNQLRLFADEIGRNFVLQLQLNY